MGFDEWEQYYFSYYERIMKTSRNFRWQGRVHETVVPAGIFIFGCGDRASKIKAGESSQSAYI